MSFAVRPMGLGASAPEVVGQAEWRTSGSFDWIVPEGVTEIHAVVVAASGNQLSGLRRGGAYIFTSNTALGATVGGGNGGPGGSGAGSFDIGGGGGGAGGYLGNGGAGESMASNGPAPAYAGQGGGGGGGASSRRSPGAGGGVGLKGVGASGAAGAMNTSGGVGSVPPDTAGVGAGRPGTSIAPGGEGGNLRYTIAPLSVTPGETLIAHVAGGPGYSGGIRIMWGGGRSYPSNAGDL